MKKAFMTVAGALLTSALFAKDITGAAEYEIPDTVLFMVLMLFIFILIIVIVVLAGTIKNLAEDKELWKSKWNRTSVVVLLLIMVSSKTASAATPVGEPFIPMTSDIIWVLGSIIVFLVSVIIFLSYLLQKMLKELRTDIIPEEQEQSILLTWERKLTDARPVELEEDILLDHEYDGIRELDNNLPPWWKYGFYFTIIFSFIYVIRYHFTGHGDLQETEYKKEIMAAEIKKQEYMKLAANKVDENSVTELEDVTSLKSGKSIFITNCAACHGQAGEGGVGPNLTDKFWIHGGDIKDVFKLIKFGNPQKGMIAWQAQLNPRQIQEVSSYILTLQGTNPENGKAPEGELFEKKVEAEEQENKEENSGKEDAKIVAVTDLKK